MTQGLDMTKVWRTVQFFISPKGIHEVQIDTSKGVKVRCNCRAYKGLFPCAHETYVKSHITDSEDGPVYSVSVPDDVSDEEAMEALGTPEKFRDFILKHGKVLSID